MVVHIASAQLIERADHAVALGDAHEPVGCFADVIGIFAFRERASLHEQC